MSKVAATSTKETAAPKRDSVTKGTAKRDTKITVRFSEAEIANVSDLCGSRGIKPSTLIRAAVADLIGRYNGRAASGIEERREADVEMHACDRVHMSAIDTHKLLVEIGRVGTNINQIARHANAGEFGDSKSVVEACDEARSVISDVIDQISMTRR